MKSLRLKFANSEGQMLSARLELPADGKPFSFALFAHCFTCNKNLNAVRNISRALSREGIGVLRFDFTGLGDSEGEFADTNFSSNVQDLIAAAHFLEQEYGAPEILIGHSLGGAAVLMAAGELPKVKAVATIGAPADPPHVKHLFENSIEEIEAAGVAKVNIGGRPFTIKKQFIDDLESVSLPERIKNLKRALLVMHGPFDQTVSIDNAAKIYSAAIHPKSFISLDGADHLLMKKEDSLYAGDMIAAWVKKYIKFPEPPELHSDKQVVARIGSEGFLTEIRAGNHALLADEPEKVGGTDLGATPYDLLVAGLGACTAMTMRMYADHKGWPVDEITVHLQHSKVHEKDAEEAEKEGGVGKIDQIERFIEIEGELSDEQKARMMKIADRCPVHRTLHNEIRIPTSLKE